MRYLRWSFYLLAAAALAVVGASFLLPAEAMVSRSAEIAAPPDRVFAIVGDLRRFHEFSPWAERDPAIRYSFEGTQSGLGQIMRWSSDNPDVGSGSQRIIAYDPPHHAEMALDFGMTDRAIASWHLVASETGTVATWRFRSDLRGIPAKWFGLMFDRWIGPDYERGLARLKTAAEQG